MEEHSFIKAILFKIISFYLLLVMLFSCNYKNNLEKALVMAEENRKELQKVLDHYHKNPEDSLKYRAACFLIENMPGHYSYSPEDLAYFTRCYDDIDSLMVFAKKEEEIDHHKVFTAFTQDKARNYSIIMDINSISADYLIKNIERSFKVWQQGSWAKQVNFEDFCEYILPYKAAERQTLDNWREYLDTFGIKPLEELRYNDLKKNSTYDACKVLNEELRLTVLPYLFAEGEYIAVKRISSLFNVPYGTCETYALLATSVMRAKGIPVVRDYTPQWPFRRQGHTWNVLLDNFGKNIVFEGCNSVPGTPHKEDHKMAKVFRETYAINREVEKLLATEKYFPSAFRNYFMKDVTEEYMATVDITIPVNKKTYYKYAYLAVFDNTSWEPIHWGKIEEGKVVFKNMGKNVVYLPVFYGKEGIIPFHEPILVTASGEVIPIKPDKKNSQLLILTRKHPVLYELFISALTTGGIFQAADNPFFNNPVTLHRIKSPETIAGEIRLDSVPNTYQYWRYYSPENAFCTMAKIQFFQKNNKEPVYGRIIGTEGSLNENDRHTKKSI